MPIPAGSTVARAGTLAATLGVVAAAACWGISAIMAKVAFEHGVPPDRMAQARAAVALLALAPLLAWRRRDLLRPPAGTLPLLLGFGVSVAAVNYAYYVAIDHLAVGVAISLQYTAPVLVLGWTVLVARGRATRLAWVAAGCTLAGAVLVSQALTGFGGLDATGLAGGAASAVLLAVIGVGLVGTLLPFFLAVAAVRVVSAATAGIAATFEPVFAATFAWLLLGQHLRPVQLAGGLLVVAGVVLAQLAPPRLTARVVDGEATREDGTDGGGPPVARVSGPARGVDEARRLTARLGRAQAVQGVGRADRHD